MGKNNFQGYSSHLLKYLKVILLPFLFFSINTKMIPFYDKL